MNPIGLARDWYEYQSWAWNEMFAALMELELARLQANPMNGLLK